MTDAYKSILKRFEEMPNLISECQTNIMILKDKLSNETWWLNKAEIDIKVLVSQQTDENNKKVFTNEDMRTAEFYSRIKSSTEYQNQKEKVDALEMQKQIEEITLQKYINEFSSLKYQVKVLELMQEQIE